MTTATADIDNLISLRNFQKKVSDLGHFYTPYKSTKDLLYQLRNQLDRIFEEMNLL
ncbi:MAG: hypothetical protein AB8H03_05590 [Saprospiraceae bacterium]